MTVAFFPAMENVPTIAWLAAGNLMYKYGSVNRIDSYIEKPFSFEHLISSIENLLARDQRLRDAFRNNPDIPAKGSIALNSLDEAFLEKVNSIILEHIGEEEFSINHLADIMNTSRSSLYRKIKGISNLPPNDFIKLCRLKRAAELLGKKEFRINEICYITGFGSPSYFTKCFQRQFGMTPKEYARRVADANR